MKIFFFLHGRKLGFLCFRRSMTITWSRDVIWWNCKQPGCGCRVMDNVISWQRMEINDDWKYSKAQLPTVPPEECSHSIDARAHRLYRPPTVWRISVYMPYFAYQVLHIEMHRNCWNAIILGQNACPRIAAAPLRVISIVCPLDSDLGCSMRPYVLEPEVQRSGLHGQMTIINAVTLFSELWGYRISSR